MRSYIKNFNNIHSQVLDPNEKLVNQELRSSIYDKHINLIIGSKYVKFFYGLLKEA